jgi:hypothetical protein
LRIFDKLGVSNRVELVLYALTQREMKTQEGALTASISAPESGPQKKVAANVSERNTTRQISTREPFLERQP